MRLEYEKATNSIIDRHILKELEGYENIIVFGAGDSGDWAVNLLRKNRIFPVCFCDNSKRKWGELKNGLYIKSFEEAVREYEGAAICVASMWYEDICRQILEYDSGYSNRIFNLLSSMAWETYAKEYRSGEYDYIKDHEKEFERLYQNLADRQSGLTLEGILNYRLTRDPVWLEKIKSNETPYLDKTVIDENAYRKMGKGVVIDGGAFDGDSVEIFVKHLGGQGALDIHCYEAESKNCKALKERIERGEWSPHSVTLHQAALWDKKGTISFGGAGLSGRVNDGGDTGILAERIDDATYDSVGMIKLDVEGAERNALEGARHTINRCRPVLAVCAYHLQDDLLTLSDFIRSLEGNYRVYLRHYMLSAGDSILYGIPYEK